jgi:hypothetical protein
MKPDDFEKQLQRHPLRAISGDWRGELLDAAGRAGDHQLSVLKPQPTPWWHELLWPCPRAWAGLSAVWVVILVLNAATREPVQVAKAERVSPPREVLMALREQRRLFVQLVGPSPPAEQPKTFIPRPRSAISHRTVTVGFA